MGASGALLACYLLASVATPRVARAAPRPPPRPARDSSPHLDNGWGGQVRLRHLYTASRSHPAWAAHLRLRDDGRVDGVERQSEHSLLEIKAVSRGVVVMRGLKSRRYLCMDPKGRLYGQVSFDEVDCTFRESLLPDGYNLYRGGTHHAVVSLSAVAPRHSHHQQQQHRQQQQPNQELPMDPQQQQQQHEWPLARGLPPLSHFLPVVNSVPLEGSDSGLPWLEEAGADIRSPDEVAPLTRRAHEQEEEEEGRKGYVDLLDPLGILSSRTSRWSWW
uniref:Fibroblast growth factor n=1 Tax=Petromyzon marinus TaxID=7757 RepID=A0AAJ7TBJ6_PETMA|nr:fibroblast growth factor 19-like [Petromyzon marinus]